MKFFQPTPIKVLFAVLLLIWYVPSDIINTEFINRLNITCPGGSCGYQLTTNLQYLIHIMDVAMERHVVTSQTLFELWLAGFVTCYFVSCIAVALYGILRKPKKTLP